MGSDGGWLGGLVLLRPTEEPKRLVWQLGRAVDVTPVDNRPVGRASLRLSPQDGRQSYRILGRTAAPLGSAGWSAAPPGGASCRPDARPSGSSPWSVRAGTCPAAPRAARRSIYSPTCPTGRDPPSVRDIALRPFPRSAGHSTRAGFFQMTTTRRRSVLLPSCLSLASPDHPLVPASFR